MIDAIENYQLYKTCHRRRRMTQPMFNPACRYKQVQFGNRLRAVAAHASRNLRGICLHCEKAGHAVQDCRARKQGDCKRCGQVSSIERRDTSSVPQTEWKVLVDKGPEIRRRVRSYAGIHGLIAGSERNVMQLGYSD